LRQSGRRPRKAESPRRQPTGSPRARHRSSGQCAGQCFDCPAARPETSRRIRWRRRIRGAVRNPTATLAQALSSQPDRHLPAPDPARIDRARAALDRDNRLLPAATALQNLGSSDSSPTSSAPAALFATPTVLLPPPHRSAGRPGPHCEFDSR
jgi:hypothetical protein